MGLRAPGMMRMQILEGIATVLVGVLALLVLVDFPVTAKFLTPEEKAYIVWKKSAFFVLQSFVFVPWTLTLLWVYGVFQYVQSVEYDNSSVGEEEHFALRHLWAALMDWQVWLHILVYFSIVAPRECLSATLCKEKG